MEDLNLESLPPKDQRTLQDMINEFQHLENIVERNARDYVPELETLLENCQAIIDRQDRRDERITDLKNIINNCSRRLRQLIIVSEDAVVQSVSDSTSTDSETMEVHKQRNSSIVRMNPETLIVPTNMLTHNYQCICPSGDKKLDATCICPKCALVESAELPRRD